jgi:hypothetical protein
MRDRQKDLTLLPVSKQVLMWYVEKKDIVKNVVKNKIEKYRAHFRREGKRSMGTRPVVSARGGS